MKRINYFLLLGLLMIPVIVRADVAAPIDTTVYGLIPLLIIIAVVIAIIIVAIVLVKKENNFIK